MFVTLNGKYLSFFCHGARVDDWFDNIIAIFNNSFFLHVGMAGLAVTYGLNLNARLSRWILSFCKLENKIISIERIYQYSQIPSEAPLVIEDSRPPTSWPESGTIDLIDLKVCSSAQLVRPVLYFGC